MLFMIGSPVSADSWLPLCFLREERNWKKGLPPDAHRVKPSHNVLPSGSDILLWWRRCPSFPIQILTETSQSAAAKPTRHKANERTASFIFELMRSQENFSGFISHEVVWSGDFCSLEFLSLKVSKASENKIARWRIFHKLEIAYRHFCNLAANSERSN